MRFGFALLLVIFSLVGGAETEPSVSTPPALPFRQITRTEISTGERLTYFGEVYAFQWAVYYLTQGRIIRNHGNLDNYLNNWYQPGFDYDSFDYNIFQHTLVGQYYYQFYRSKGYTEKAAFGWAFASSAAFEFAVETLTEKPSFQDIYQTPVFGSLLGMGLERLSCYLYSTHVWPAQALGALLNPFSLLPSSQYRFAVSPVYSKDAAGAVVSLDF